MAVVGCEMVGLLATPVTISAIPTWYAHLNKPFFSPPNYVFGPVWMILYFLMGLAFYLVWQKGTKDKTVRVALAIFGLQLALNLLWSLIFFGGRAPFLAFIEIIILWATIALTTVKFFKISRTAAYLLIPYLLWVSFAAILNGAIVFLNP